MSWISTVTIPSVVMNAAFGANVALDLKTSWRASLPERQQPPMPVSKNGVVFAFR